MLIAMFSSVAMLLISSQICGDHWLAGCWMHVHSLASPCRSLLCGVYVIHSILLSSLILGVGDSFTFMQQVPHQSNGPSPPRPAASSLRFRKASGFTVHKQKADEGDSTTTRQHTKIQLDSHGTLRLTTHMFSTPGNAPKTTTVQWGALDHHDHLSYPGIPECKDRLPPKVDLDILDKGPRPRMESVS